MKTQCDQCNGTGKIQDESCPRCCGGITTTDRPVLVVAFFDAPVSILWIDKEGKTLKREDVTFNK